MFSPDGRLQGTIVPPLKGRTAASGYMHGCLRQTLQAQQLLMVGIKYCKSTSKQAYMHVSMNRVSSDATVVETSVLQAC
jgi:hypothetical protein